MEKDRIEKLDRETLRRNANAATKFCAFYHNIRFERLFRRILTNRSEEDVRDSWRKLGFENESNVLRRTLAASFGWNNDRFRPDDECFVVFRRWRKAFADDLTTEEFFCEFESRFGREVPTQILTDEKATLSDFFETVGGVPKKFV